MSATAASRLFILIWAAGFVLGGLLFATLGYFHAREAIQSNDWPSVAGQIISKKIDVTHNRDSDGHRTTSYEPKVIYEFRVDEQIYQAERMQIGLTSYNTRAKASDAIDRLTDGDKCTVFYNPENPEVSTLEVGFQLHHGMFIGFGLLFCMIGIGGAWLFLANTKGGRSATPGLENRAQQSELDEPFKRPQTEAFAPGGPRTRTLEQNITRWGREHIDSGDDTPIDWKMISSFDDGHLSYVEVEPSPNEVGYDKFIFVISFKRQPPDLIATYCLEGGRFLLFSRNAGTDEELPDELSGV